MARILVVDDESQVRELMRDALGAKGYEVATVPTAEQALAAVSQEPFDLILLDIKLTGESGISVIKKIRELRSKVPVVIYSGVITAEIEREARIAGANEVLSKDIGIAQLVERIGKIAKAGNRIFPDSSRRKDKSILIVDDETEVRHILRDFFRKRGYSTLEAESGEEALGLARSGDISAVLLDIKMPGMGGLAALGKLLEINPKLGVIMVTASQDDEKVKKAIEMGAYSYVLKPFDLLYLELVVMSKLAIAESG